MKTAHLLTGMLILTASSTTSRLARADGPPPATATTLTPPEVSPSPAPVVASPTEPMPNTQPAEFLPGPHPSRLAAYIFAGAAVVGVGVGATFGALALHYQSNYNADPTASSRGLANQDSVVADVGLGAAIIAGVTSVVLFMKDEDPGAASGSSSGKAAPAAPPRAMSAPHLTVAPTFSSRGAGAGAVLRF